MAVAVWQQALALDARYNAYRAPNNPQFSKHLSNSIVAIYIQSIIYLGNETSLLLACGGVAHPLYLRNGLE